MEKYLSKKTGFANLPQEVEMKEFPNVKMSPDDELDDTIRGIDEVETHSEKQRKKYLSNQK